MTRFYLGKKDQSVKINMTTEQKEAVVKAAKEVGLSISDFTMMLYDQYFSQDGTQDDTVSSITPSEMPLEPMEEKEEVNSKKTVVIPRKEGLSGSDVIELQEDAALVDEFKYMNPDLGYYLDLAKGITKDVISEIRATYVSLLDDDSIDEDVLASEKNCLVAKAKLGVEVLV